MVVLGGGGGAVSYERGTPVGIRRYLAGSRLLDGKVVDGERREEGHQLCSVHLFSCGYEPFTQRCLFCSRVFGSAAVYVFSSHLCIYRGKEPNG